MKPLVLGGSPGQDFSEPLQTLQAVQTSVLQLQFSTFPVCAVSTPRGREVLDLPLNLNQLFLVPIRCVFKFVIGF